MSLVLRLNELKAYENTVLVTKNPLFTLKSDRLYPTKNQHLLRTVSFINGLSSKSISNSKTTDLKALSDVIWLVHNSGATPIQEALLKKSGFFIRWFSTESWENWTEKRTALGQVVDLYRDYEMGSSTKRLDKKLLDVANLEAAAILESLKSQRHEKTTLSKNWWSSFFSLPIAEAVELTSFPPDFNLSSLNGANGFVLDGENLFDESGISVANAGDINGDGIDDLIIGAPRASPKNRFSAGKTYVIYGSSNSWDSPLQLSSLNGTNGFAIYGTTAGESSGKAVAGVGDINGDGIDDVIIGAPYGKKGAGISYVVFGSRESRAAYLELSSLDGKNGFALYGEKSLDSSGSAVAGVGDFNDDGINDVIVGAPYASNNRIECAGRSYVVFGAKGLWTTPIQLSSLNGKNGFALYGERSLDYSGSTLASVGDFNDDGINDMILGAPGSSPDLGSSPEIRAPAGKTYVIFGSKSPWKSPFQLSAVNGRNGFAIYGANKDDQSGYSVAGINDINGDRIDDLLIGAPYASPQGRKVAGQSYVMFGGRRSLWSSPFDLSTLNGINGFFVNGKHSRDSSGFAVAGAGDVNNDGIYDLIIGALFASPDNITQGGSSYVIFGSNTSWNRTIEVANLNGSNGFTLNAEHEYDRSGIAVAGVGDINHDGIADFAIGASGASIENKPDVGKTYIVFGV